MPIINIYTDGSCLNNQRSKKGQSYGGYGGYIKYPNGDEEEYSAGLSGSKITNNIGEFMAFKYAVERMIEIDTRNIIHIYTDSTYLINTYTKWIKDWERNGWKKANNKDIENVELIQEIYSLMKDSRLIFIFKKVKAHENEPPQTSSKWIHWYGNNRADSLAVTCATDMQKANEAKQEIVEPEEDEEEEEEVKTPPKKRTVKAKTTKVKEDKPKAKKITKKKSEPLPEDL
jgi:ribonuclease HI